MSSTFHYILFFLEILILYYVLSLLFCSTSKSDDEMIEHFVLKSNLGEPIDPILERLQEKLRPLFEDDTTYDGLMASVNRKKILNQVSLAKGNKSYTLNKEDIFLCVHDEKGAYYDENLLIYVLLHEIAHSLNVVDIGHTPRFHKIFDELLQKATKMGIYDPSKEIRRDYCMYND